MNQLSKESLFIKRIAVGFIFLSSIASLFFIWNLIRILFLVNNSSTSVSFPIKNNLSIISYYMFNYFKIISTLCVLITVFSLVASIKLYQLKNRKLFLYALICNIILILIINLFFYSYLEFGHSVSNLLSGDMGYNNFWYIEIYPFGFISTLFIVGIIYLIIKVATKKIKQEFVKSND